MSFMSCAIKTPKVFYIFLSFLNLVFLCHIFMKVEGIKIKDCSHCIEPCSLGQSIDPFGEINGKNIFCCFTMLLPAS